MENIESAQEHHGSSTATGNRKRSRCLESGSPCDDILMEIIKRLPIKSLFRLKRVSRNWHDLISHEIRARNPFMSVLVSKCSDPYRTIGHGYASDFDGSFNKYDWDFFEFHKSSEIVDSCNGLVLLHSSKSQKFYVSDPIKKKWLSLPRRVKKWQIAVLDFDPSISAYFKVICLCSKMMEIFCTEMGEWVVHKLDLTVNLRLWKTTVCCFNGAVYILAPPTHIVGINLDDGRCSKIELPVDYIHANAVHWPGLVLGKSGGFLQFVRRDRAQTRIWMLNHGEKKEWVLKHRISNQAMEEPIQQPLSSVLPQSILVAFHPQLEIVFFYLCGKLLSYHLEKKKVGLVFDFGLVSNFGSEIVYVQLCVFPFLGNTLRLSDNSF